MVSLSLFCYSLFMFARFMIRVPDRIFKSAAFVPSHLQELVFVLYWLKVWFAETCRS